MRACLCAVMLATTAAQAEMPPSDGVEPGFDILYNVPEVQTLTINSPAGTLYAAVTPLEGEPGTGSDIVQWQLDPIRLGAIWRTETLVSDLEISPAGLVYAAGQQGASTGSDNGRAARSGSVIALDPAQPGAEPAVIVSYSDVKDSVAVARFNQAAYDGSGHVFLTTPTQFSVAIFPDSLQPVQRGTTLPQLVLECGAPAQFSMYRLGDRSAYVASTADGALLETGVVDAGQAGAPSASCFRVTNVFGYESEPPTLNSVVHALLADGTDNVDAVLALEPNTGILHLLHLDAGTQQLSRADWVDLATKAPGTLTLLAASRDGSIIFVGGHEQEDILRFRREGDRLVRAGVLRTGAGLKQIEISPDGAYAVLVMGDRAELDRIHVIRSPAVLGDGPRDLPRGGETLRRIQAELNDAGFDVGPADGILGPRTASAISQIRQQDTSIESGVSDLRSVVDGVFILPFD